MPTDEPDLTAELDAAEALVLHDIATVTEWGLRKPGVPDAEIFGDPGEEGRKGAVSFMHGMARGTRPVRYELVRRTVTYGPWETVPDEH